MPSEELPSRDQAALVKAKGLLESPGLVAKVTNYIGTPIEMALEYLPHGWQTKLDVGIRDALTVALKAALLTMGKTETESYPTWHKIAAALSGAVGGAFGLPALIIELPVSTTIILRSIADTARANGEDLVNPEPQLACLEVFALGGPSKGDDAADGGYFAVRIALGKAVQEAAQYMAEKIVVEEVAPALARLISLIAVRLQGPIAAKAAAQAVPVLGAAAGAVINLMFIDHFQDMAEGHFTVRRLERKYGKIAIRKAYDAI